MLNLEELKGTLLLTATDPEQQQNDVESISTSDNSTRSTDIKHRLKLHLPRLRSVNEGNMTLLHLTALTASQLENVNGDIHIHDSRLNLQLPALRECTGTGVLSLRNVHLENGSEEPLAANLTRLTGDLSFVNVKGAQNLSSLVPRISSIGGSLVVRSENALDDYSHSKLERISGSLIVSASDTNGSSWDCQKLKQLYVDTGIVRGAFRCNLAGQTMDLSASSSTIASSLSSVFLAQMIFTVVGLSMF